MAELKGAGDKPCLTRKSDSVRKRGVENQNLFRIPQFAVVELLVALIALSEVLRVIDSIAIGVGLLAAAAAVSLFSPREPIAHGVGTFIGVSLKTVLDLFRLFVVNVVRQGQNALIHQLEVRQ